MRPLKNYDIEEKNKENIDKLLSLNIFLFEDFDVFSDDR